MIKRYTLSLILPTKYTVVSNKQSYVFLTYNNVYVYHVN